MASRVSRAVPAEDIDVEIRTIKSALAEARNSMRHSLRDPKLGRRVIPDIRDVLDQRLRDALEDEVIPLVPLSEQEGIVALERDHEIIKKALVGLKAEGLRRVAKDLRVPVGGNLDELSTRIARAYNWDSEEIARLVLQYEEEPDPERGFVSRLYPIGADEDFFTASEKLEEVAGRYVRVNIAQWFVIESVRRTGRETVIDGRHEAYQAGVDPRGDEPEIRSESASRGVRAVLGSNTGLEIRTAFERSARAAIGAVRLVGRVSPLGWVPHTGAEAAATLGTVHGASEFLLDLVVNRYASLGFNDLDITIVRFRMSDAPRSNDETRRPALRALRLEGNHLLDEPEACQLLVKDRKELAEISFRVSTTIDQGQSTTWLPVKVGLERDHLLVATGFGTNPEAARGVHRALVDAAWREIKDGAADQARLDRLIERISDRAVAEEAPDTAQIVELPAPGGATEE